MNEMEHGMFFQGKRKNRLNPGPRPGTISQLHTAYYISKKGKSCVIPCSNTASFRNLLDLSEVSVRLAAQRGRKDRGQRPVSSCRFPLEIRGQCVCAFTCNSGAIREVKQNQAC